VVLVQDPQVLQVTQEHHQTSQVLQATMDPTVVQDLQVLQVLKVQVVVVVVQDLQVLQDPFNM
jgi:hypothetical protein